MQNFVQIIETYWRHFENILIFTLPTSYNKIWSVSTFYFFEHNVERRHSTSESSHQNNHNEHTKHNDLSPRSETRHCNLAPRFNKSTKFETRRIPDSKKSKHVGIDLDDDGWKWRGGNSCLVIVNGCYFVENTSRLRWKGTSNLIPDLCHWWVATPGIWAEFWCQTDRKWLLKLNCASAWVPRK